MSQKEKLLRLFDYSTWINQYPDLRLANAQVAEANAEDGPPVIDGVAHTPSRAGRACRVCKIVNFPSVAIQRAHFKTEQHLSKLKNPVTSDDEEDDQSDADDEAEGPASLSKHECLLFVNGNHDMSIFRSILFPKSRQAPTSSQALDAFVSASKCSHWSFFMFSGGKFAYAVFDNKTGVCAQHSTVQKYTVRKKQGGNQRSRDAQGNAPQSAGAALRRHNEEQLEVEVNAHIDKWKAARELRQESVLSELIWLYTPGSFNRTFITNALGVSDVTRLRVIPFAVHKITQQEIKTCYDRLSIFTVNSS